MNCNMCFKLFKEHICFILMSKLKVLILKRDVLTLLEFQRKGVKRAHEKVTGFTPQ